jgi:hypothetical protein
VIAALAGQDDIWEFEQGHKAITDFGTRDAIELFQCEHSFEDHGICGGNPFFISCNPAEKGANTGSVDGMIAHDMAKDRVCIEQW